MRLLLSGYGGMGREVEAALTSRGHEVAARVDPNAQEADVRSLDDLAESPAASSNIDAVIEFALPEGIVERARRYCDGGYPTVIGTTGWDDQRETVRRIVEDAGGALLWASNFSIGAQLFLRLARHMAGLADPFDDYDVYVHEVHHRNKADSPSGTALSIAGVLLSEIRRKEKLLTESAHRKIAKTELHVTSTRGGAHPGEHRVVFDSPADSIELVHRARNRSGFSTGAVVAAEWLRGKQGFFSIDDLLADMIDNE